jgi:uncharacterized Fe-S cluster protein YjdI
MANETTQPEIASGDDVEIRYDSRLCIHSRFCVLQAPNVFKANTLANGYSPIR